MDIVERLRKPINEKEDYFIAQWPNEEPHTKDVVRFEAADEIERLREALQEIDKALTAWMPEHSPMKNVLQGFIQNALKEKE